MLVWQFRLMGDTVKGKKDGSMMICGKYLLSYGDGCDENLMTKKESATATTCYNYHNISRLLAESVRLSVPGVFKCFRTLASMFV